MAQIVTFRKQWDGNEREREAANGRIYVSRGRWQWIVVVDGLPDDRSFDSLHEARAYARRTYPGGTFSNKRVRIEKGDGE